MSKSPFLGGCGSTRCDFVHEFAVMQRGCVALVSLWKVVGGQVILLALVFSPSLLASRRAKGHSQYQ